MPSPEADATSLSNRPTPSWYDDAKFGVMIHWGLYSVPGWAERAGTIQELWGKRGPNYYFKHNPYAEWYANTIKIPRSAAQRHHAATYGANTSYEAFAADFDAASATADFSAWADLFVRAHAQYAVLTTKHMDGFCLWPSEVANPHKQRYHAARDIVADFSAAVRSRGLTMGLYYSAGYDMTFNATVIRDAASALRAIPQGGEYAAYVDRQLTELIERYRPAVLWNDIAYPTEANLERLLAFYYQTVPAGLVNDRWVRIDPISGLSSALLGGVSAVLPIIWPVLPSSLRRFKVPQSKQYDFSTPEYATERDVVAHKWEAVRGIGPSFGNNRNERDSDLPTTDELIRLLVDVVSKNGNLLLGVGPEPNGTFPELQQDRLRGIGQWLDVNGEAIFKTRPWRRAEGVTGASAPIRFTCSDSTVYAIVLDPVSPGRLIIKDVPAPENAAVRLLGLESTLDWERIGQDLAITIPMSVQASPAHTFRIG